MPGWLQGVIGQMPFKGGIAQKALGDRNETLSRVIDPYDRDSMIFSDGAGAVLWNTVIYLPRQGHIIRQYANPRAGRG